MDRRMQNTCLCKPEFIAVDSHPTLAQRLRAMRRAVSSMLLTSFVLSPYGVLAAEPVADSTAPTNQRPLLTTVGTVPVVNIVAPGSNGISHNKYERFDVPTQGAVLNNSQTSVTSTLAGSLPGNPNLTAGARVILNEVTSNQPSSLLGQLEVAGQAARVVIANPNGITCDGCGFINTPHVQLAAARPFFEGDTLRFELGNGRLDVGPLGLKALATRLDLIAGSIATAGPLESRNAINMVAGGDASVDENLNTLRNATGLRKGSGYWSEPYNNRDFEPPAIDIGQSVSAGSVRLVLDSQTNRTIRIRSAIRAAEDVMVASRGVIDVEGQVVAGRDIAFANRGGILVLARDRESGPLVLDAGRDIQLMSWQLNARSLRAGRDIQIGVEQVDGYSSNYAQADVGSLDAGRDVLLSSDEMNIAFYVNQLRVGRDLTSGPTPFPIVTGLQQTPGAAGQMDHYSTDLIIPSRQWGENYLGNETVQGGVAISRGSVGQDARFSVYAGSEIHIGRDLHLNLCDFCDNSHGNVTADGDIYIRSEPIRVFAYWGVRGIGRPEGRLVAAGDVYFSGALSASFRDSDAEYAHAIPLEVRSGRDIVIDAPGRFANVGTLTAGGNFIARTGGEFLNLATIDAAQDVVVTAASFKNAPFVKSQTTSSRQPLYPGCTTGDIGTCTAVVESATGEARVLAGRDIVIDAPKVHNIGGTLIAARNIDIATNDFLNQDRELIANWQSTYAIIDGLLLTKQGTTAGTTVLATIPGVIQAGGLFTAREYPREPVLPPGDSTGGDTEPTPGDDEEDGSGGSGADPGSGTGTGSGTNNGGGSGTTTGNGSGSGGTRPPVVILPPPVVAPPFTPPPVVTPPEIPPDTPPAVSTPTPAVPLDAPTNPPTRFVNTGVIQAGAIVIHADEIRNGFDPVADYHRRTDLPSLPPATVALAAPLAQATDAKAMSSGGGGGAMMRKLLPADLGGSLPFAFDAATEQAALRRALQESTGRRIILPEALGGSDGLDAETRQWAALQANAAAFALTNGIALGTQLSEAQIAQLDAPMLWYVEQGGRLVPQLVLPETERLRLAKLPGGLLQADALVALAADKVVNTGYVISGGTLAIDADVLSNLKRSTYYYEQHRVDRGTLITEGDTVQPGGFMQALRWSLGAQEIQSRGGEFRVTGADDAATAAASAAFAVDIAAALGEDFHYSEATDNLESRFIADKKKGGLSGLLGVVVAVVVAIVATPAVSAWVAGAAGATEAAAAGSAWAAATATTSAGIANLATTSFITGTVSSAAGQLASTGKVDLDAALRNGLVSGLTSGITNAAFGSGQSADSLAGLSNQSGTLQPVAGASTEWADKLLGIGARSVVSAGIQSAINGTSFETALRDALVGDLAAIGANQIGTHLQSVKRALAHASLGAIAAELTGKDAASGAIGALTSALAAQPINDALGLTSDTRKVAVTALAMLSGGIVSDALGYDPVTAANAALNEVTNNYLNHAEASELERLRIRCAAGRCSEADRAEIARLQVLDRGRNQQLEAACTNPSTLACQNAYLDLARALSSFDGRRIEPGSVGDRELSEIVALEYRIRQTIKNPELHNALAGATQSVVGGLAATAELALLTVKAAFGDVDAQRALGTMVEAAGEFLQHPIDQTERAIKATLDDADRLEAAGRIDEAQRLRAGLITDGALAITGAGAVVVKGTGRVLGSLSKADGGPFDVATMTKREEQLVIDQNRIANNRSADGSALDFPRELRTSSGMVIRANPDKTTTVLGSHGFDMKSIIETQMDIPVGIVDTGPSRPGAFNILNVPDEMVVRLGSERFWNEVNKPFLDAVIARGDDIVLATRPSLEAFEKVLPDGSVTRSIFGLEYDYLKRKGYRYDSATGYMIR